MQTMRILVYVLPLALGGCVASALAGAAVDVVTLPVKAASATVDALTTSQDEADRNRGRKLRKAEEAYGREVKAWEKACDKATKGGRQCPPRPEFTPPK